MEFYSKLLTTYCQLLIANFQMVVLPKCFCSCTCVKNSDIGIKIFNHLTCNMLAVSISSWQYAVSGWQLTVGYRILNSKAIRIWKQSQRLNNNYMNRLRFKSYVLALVKGSTKRPRNNSFELFSQTHGIMACF